MVTKATYDYNVKKALWAQLDAISLRVGVDPSVVPKMLPYLEQLSFP